MNALNAFLWLVQAILLALKLAGLATVSWRRILTPLWVWLGAGALSLVTLATA